MLPAGKEVPPKGAGSEVRATFRESFGRSSSGKNSVISERPGEHLSKMLMLMFKGLSLGMIIFWWGKEQLSNKAFHGLNQMDLKTGMI